MKLVLAVLLCVSYPAFAAHDEWTSADTYREAAFFVVDAVDWAQTRNIAKKKSSQVLLCQSGVTVCDVPTHYEHNILLGNHPSISQVNRYFALGALVHIGLAYALPKDWRIGFQYVSLGVELGCVNHNHSLGISAKF
jgi:hypothetical protein